MVVNIPALQLKGFWSILGSLLRAQKKNKRFLRPVQLLIFLLLVGSLKLQKWSHCCIFTEFQCASEILPWDSQSNCINIFQPKINSTVPHWSYFFLLRLHRQQFYWEKEFSCLSWGNWDSYFEIQSLRQAWGTKTGKNEKSIPSKRKKKPERNKGKHERFIVVYQGRVGLLCLWVSNLNLYFLATSIRGEKKRKKT